MITALIVNLVCFVVKFDKNKVCYEGFIMFCSNLAAHFMNMPLISKVCEFDELHWMNSEFKSF